MKKIRGLILMLIGFVLLLSNFSPLNKIVGGLFSEIPQVYVLGAGVVLVLIGLILTRGKKKLKEDLLPIFEGKNIVGYHKGNKR